MAKADELKKSIRESVKNIVEEVIGDIVYKIVKTSTKRVINKLKGKVLHKLESCLQDISKHGLEGQLDKSSQRVAEQLNRISEHAAEKLAEDSFKGADFIRNIEHDLEKGFRKGLLSPFKLVLIACITVVVIGGGAVVWANNQPETAPPPLQPPPLQPPRESRPDLVIMEVGHEWTTEGAVIHYLITNQGEAESGESVTVLFYDGRAISEDFVEPMPPGGAFEREFPAYPLPETGFEVEIRADIENRIDESNEENNNRWYQWVLPPPGSTVCLDFEHLELGMKYKVYDNFSDSETPISVGAYSTNDFLTYTVDGFATVVDEGYTNTSGQAIYLNRVTLYLDFEGSLSGLTFNFGEEGKFYYLVINDDVLDFGNFADIDGEIIGGVNISIQIGPDNKMDENTGTVTLSGGINSFGIGGEGLYIDHACLNR